MVVTSCRASGSVFLVFEYCAHDLARLLDVGGARFEAGEAKCLLQQLLRGLAFLHSRWIIHRDLKLSNLLLTDRCAAPSCWAAWIPLNTAAAVMWSNRMRSCLQHRTQHKHWLVP
jgi:Protein kinase domain